MKRIMEDYSSEMKNMNHKGRKRDTACRSGAQPRANPE